jgi:hypothetical protein
VVSNLVVATLGPGSTVELQSSSAIMGTVDGVDGVDGGGRLVPVGGPGGPVGRGSTVRPARARCAGRSLTHVSDAR